MDRQQPVEKYTQDLESIDRQISKAEHYSSEALNDTVNAKRDYESWSRTLEEGKQNRELVVATLRELGVPEEDLW